MVKVVLSNKDEPIAVKTTVKSTPIVSTTVSTESDAEVTKVKVQDSPIVKTGFINSEDITAIEKRSKLIPATV